MHNVDILECAENVVTGYVFETDFVHTK